MIVLSTRSEFWTNEQGPCRTSLRAVCQKVLMPPDSRRPVQSDNRGMSAKEKFRQVFHILRDNGLYIVVGIPTLFVIACVTLILNGKSFLIALLGALIFVLGLAYVLSLLVLGIVFLGNDYPTTRKRRRRK
jgi:hypothetical protein